MPFFFVLNKDHHVVEKILHLLGVQAIFFWDKTIALLDFIALRTNHCGGFAYTNSIRGENLYIRIVSIIFITTGSFFLLPTTTTTTLHIRSCFLTNKRSRVTP